MRAVPVAAKVYLIADVLREETMKDRIYNFNAGPAVLPLSVLEEIQEELPNFKGSGMSIIEVSHRSKWFEGVLEETITRIKRLFNLGDEFKVLFIQGGASLQFSMVPMNLAPEVVTAAYVNTDTWSANAIKEARIQKKNVSVVASSEDRSFCYIPSNIQVPPDAAYLHYTSNNTIKGTQFASLPESGKVPLISDMSSDIMSRTFDPRPFGLIYAGAQKNLGPAGVCLVIIREDMLAGVPASLPTMLKYTTYVEHNSLFNTPPCFAIYVVGLVMKWLEETIGGLKEMERRNREKAELLYRTIDANVFYRGTADSDSRSMMNVTFRLPTEDLENRFIAGAQKNGMGGLKGHRSVGGCRASLYNALSLDAVKALVDFMVEFARNNG
jgi:phosphoserine aminotransferase